MIGVVLCGGQSFRMGADKGLLKNETGVWARTAFDKLAALNIPVKISVNDNQYSSYAGIFSAEELITDNTSFQVKGPLLGMMSTYLRYPADAIFVLACDMLLMEVFILQRLMKIFREQQDAGACVYTSDGEPEPLCGIYKPESIESIITMYESGKLSKHSMKFMLDHINTHKIPLGTDDKKFFRNFNSHAELNGL
jgi:molybdenum cofactor guanylyltransferase